MGKMVTLRDFEVPKPLFYFKIERSNPPIVVTPSNAHKAELGVLYKLIEFDENDKPIMVAAEAPDRKTVEDVKKVVEHYIKETMKRMVN